MPAAFRDFPDFNSMIAGLADDIVTRLKQDVRLRGSASMAVPGGTTPGPLFDLLSGRDAPWDKIWITLTDERWIATTQDSSNEHLVRTRLLRDKAANAHFVGMKTADAKARDGEAKASAAIISIPRPFTVMLLGMGDDGHTASLFPHAAELKQALDISDPALVRAIIAKGAAQTDERISLSLRAVLDSEWIVILIKGADKRVAYEAAVGGSDVSEMPVRAVLNQQTVPVAVYWCP
jgi:6-phosphogluconolactonase